MDATRVEKIIPKQQAAMADIRVGDYLIAINAINTTTAPSRIALRLITEAAWPIVLVFESQRHVRNPALEAQEVSKRLFNMSVLYPPSMVHEFQFKVADWSGSDRRLSSSMDSDVCNVYVIHAAQDMYGCENTNEEMDLLSRTKNMFTYLRYRNRTRNANLIEASAEIDSSGDSNRLETSIAQNEYTEYTESDIKSLIDELFEYDYPMLSMLMHEIYHFTTTDINVDISAIQLMKRGTCTFVEKAKKLAVQSLTFPFHAGIVINTEDELIDMPAGKENTTLCTKPLGIAKDKDGSLLQISAESNEMIGLILNQKSQDSSQHSLSKQCMHVQTLIEDILDKWPHNIPKIPLDHIVSSAAITTKKYQRSLSEEGGRVALSGVNGWVYFDYHLAMFGPQVVPLGPYPLQMAFPPHGCDASQYTVRIKNKIVAILRGGGCSFGIKVINAQKLGALAVIIVNTDDMKTLRLNALPDELPLIKIPCIMVSRRIQFYFEELLRKYKYIDNHIVSIQPMIYMSEYEKRNTVVLPVRLTAPTPKK